MPAKHVPLRTCINCRTTRPKRELTRVVALTEQHCEVDPSGKKNGRGAYLCRQRACWDSVLSNPARLTSALKMPVMNAEDMANLREFALKLPVRIEARAPIVNAN